MSERKIRNYGRTDYIIGNTVRKTSPKRPEPYLRSRQSQARPNKSLAMNGVSVAFFAAVTVFILALFVGYLNVQAQITETKANIKELKSDISTVKSQNDAMKYSINALVGSENIYKVATTKLGMRQAKENQIAIYKSTDSGYTVQYGEIPSK